MRWRTILVLAATALWATACLTSSRESALGDKEAEKVEKSMGLVDDPIPTAYVRAIGERLAALSTRPEGPWRFLLVDSEDPNAFALPGGHVYVTRGLLALVNSEDELAGVIGHEIGHVTARHSAKRIGAAVLTAPVSLASAIAGAAVGLVSPLLRDVVQGTGKLVTGGLVLAPYSRAQESEADVIGQTLAARAGYDPLGISSFMHTLDREAGLHASDELRFHFLDSHPAPADRAEKTAARAATLTQAPRTPLARDRASLFAKFDGLLVGPDPSEGVFRENRFLHPGMDLAIDFPEGWKTINTPEAAGAISPEQDAVVAMRFVAADTTLAAVLEKAREEQRNLEFTRSTIRDLPAARTVHSSGGQTADITLIGYGGDVLAIVGQTKAATASQFTTAFSSTAQSFRALRTSERASIQESRLRVKKARSGETPKALVARFGSSWTAAEAAVANGVDLDAALPAGRLVKIAMPQPYTR